MIGWTRIHLMQFREALKDGLELQTMASEVRNDRALMFGKTLVGIMQYELGDLEQSEAALHDAAALAKSMSSSNGFAQTLRALALVKHKQDRLEEARAYAEEALAAVRKAGMTFIGRLYWLRAPLSAKIKLDASTSSRKQNACSSEAAWHTIRFGLLRSGLMMPWPGRTGDLRYVMQICWSATRKRKPLEWSTFMIRRARALARVGQGDKSSTTITELQLLADQARLCGLINALPALAEALASKPPTHRVFRLEYANDALPANQV